MRESRTYGSVRGALSNERPYRDRRYAPRNDGFWRRALLDLSLSSPFDKCFNGSWLVCFNRSSTIEERTCATLSCGRKTSFRRRDSA
jgi:hypothetical protein